MLTVNTLSPGQQLREPLDVTVTGVDWAPIEKRRAHVHLVDMEGVPIRLVDFEGSDILIDWSEGRRYRISQCGVHSGGGEYELDLTPSKRTHIEPLDPPGQRVRFMVIGDTHVGRTEHPGNGTEINPAYAFVQAVRYGIEQDVAAVIHVGDIFHESAGSFEAKIVDQFVFDRLEDARIPFYYVRGNHSSAAGDDLLANRAGELVSTLHTNGTLVDSAVCLFGIDHHPNGNLPSEELSFPTSVDAPVSILVLHQTLAQLSGSTPDSVDLRVIQQRFEGHFDAILSGHHHDATRKRWKGCEVLYTGAAEKMSKNLNPTDRVAWLLTIENGSVMMDQYDIPES